MTSAAPTLYGFSGDGKKAAEELSVAETNLDSILKAAKKVQQVLLPITAAEFKPDDLESLIYDLKAVYSEIRRRIKTHHPRADLLGGKAWSSRDRSPPTNLDKYHCVCPLTVFLRLVAHSLTRSYMNIAINYENTGIEPSPKAKNPWGDIQPLRRVLISLSEQLRGMKANHDAKDKYYPGIAQCIMFHNENSQFTVTSSSTRYSFLPGLSAVGIANRQEHIHRLTMKCTPEQQARIKAVESTSTDLFNHGEEEAQRSKSLDGWQTPFDRDGTRVSVAGQGATFTPQGNYRLACLIDYCRFSMDKASEPTMKETKGKPHRRPYFPADSCAEWELWITILSDSRTTEAPQARYPKTAQPGDPRSNSNPSPQPGTAGPPMGPLKTSSTFN